MPLWFQQRDDLCFEETNEIEEYHEVAKAPCVAEAPTTIRRTASQAIAWAVV